MDTMCDYSSTVTLSDFGYEHGYRREVIGSPLTSCSHARNAVLPDCTKSPKKLGAYVSSASAETQHNRQLTLTGSYILVCFIFARAHVFSGTTTNVTEHAWTYNLSGYRTQSSPPA